MNGLNIIETKDLALTYPEKAKTIQVKDQISLGQANDFLLGIKKLSRAIEDSYDPQIQKAHELHKSLLEEKKKYTLPLAFAEMIIKKSIGIYLQEQEQIRREQKEIRKRAEEERRRIEEEALRKAQEAEIRAAETKNEEEKKEAQEEVNKFLEQAAIQEEKLVNEMPKEIEKPKVEGLSLHDHWTFEIIDEKLIPREFLVVDRQKINLFVQQHKEKANISGVRIYCEKIMAARIK